MATPGKNGDETNWGKIAFIGFEVAIGVGVGAFIGSWVDRKYRTDPWGLMIGTAIGFATGIYMLVKEAFAINKNDGDK